MLKAGVHSVVYGSVAQCIHALTEICVGPYMGWDDKVGVTVKEWFITVIQHIL